MSNPTLTFYHGTSEALLQHMLEQNLQRPPQTAQDRLRDVLLDYLAPEKIDDKLMQDVMQQHLRFTVRLEENDSGKTMYATSDPETATKYAGHMKDHGGEFAKDIFTALQKLGFTEIQPRFQNARPVMLELAVPLKDISDEGGKVEALDNGQSTIGGYEVYINTTARSAIRSVTFGRPDPTHETGWSFAGQKPLSPIEAMREIAAVLRDRKVFADPNPEKTDVLNTIYSVQELPEARLRHQRLGGSHTEVKLTGADGRPEWITIPDPEFKAEAPQLTKFGFPGHEEKYKLPHNLNAREIDAYANALALQERLGNISVDDRLAGLGRMADRLQQDNPQLRGVVFSRENPQHLDGFLRAAAHGYKPDDIQHHLTAAGDSPAYQAQRRQSLGVLARHVSINPAPATLSRMGVQMAESFAAEQKRQAAQQPATPKA